MANIAIFRINYKSDFILTLNSDAGWLTPFCIKFWTGAPSQAYFAGYDGETYTHCAPVEGEPTKLVVQFDDHHLPIGDLKFQIGYHFTVTDFPTSVEDEVLNQASVIIEVNDAPAQVMLDLNGETAPEIEFSLPAYANEAQRIANEQARIAAEQQRIANEDARIQAEETRQQNEAQRIAQETARVNEFATLKSQSQAATRNANDAATLANQKAQLAADKAALADDAATLAIQKAQLAAEKAVLANDAAQLANEKAALAQQKAEYAQQQGSYAKDQGDYAKDQGDYAKEQGEIAQEDHVRAEADHGIAVDDHTQAGNDHTRAESDHGIAADDHTQAGNDHTRAESDHGIAANDHTQAGNDHTRAESDHGIAADDHTQAGNDHTRAESDHTRAESDHAAVEVYVDSLGAFDISAYHATGGVLAKYADLTAALGTNGANIPEVLRKGGMSVKFVLSSDNKYVQYRLMSDSFNTTVANWQGVDEEPKVGSHNLVESGGVYEEAIKAGLKNSKLLPFVNSGQYINLLSVEIGQQYTISLDSATNYGNWEIDCNEGDRFALSVGGNTVAAKRYAILDADGYVLAFLQGDSFVTDYIVTIPTGGKKLLVNSSSSGNPVVKKLNAVSEQLTEFEGKALIKEQQSLTDVEKGQVKDNLGFVSQDDLNIPITNFISGYFILSNSGLQVGDKLYLTPLPNSRYKHAIINCNEGDIFVATTTGYTANAKSYVILDINSCVLAFGAANLNNSEITIPVGGKQIVFNTTQTTPNVLLYAGKLTRTLEGIESLNRETHAYKDLGYSESGYYYVANTVSVGDTLTITKQSATGLVCTLLDCQYGDKFSYMGKKNGANRTYVFLDSNNVVVGISRDTNATYEGEVVAPLTSAKAIFNTTTDIEYYLKKYVSIIDEDEKRFENIELNIQELSAQNYAMLPLCWQNQFLYVAGNVGDVATLTAFNFSNYGYLKIHVKAGYIFKISTSGNTSSAEAFAVLDEGLVIKEIQQNSVTNKVIAIEEDGWLIINSNKSSYSIEMVNGNLLWGNQTFYSLFSKLYDVARFNNNYQFDQVRIEQLEVNGLKLGFYQNVPLEGQYINTDIFEREAITDESSFDFIQKRIVPYLYWNQNKVGTMVLFDGATGKPYIYDKNGNKVMLKIDE